jgi:hypothetical protein
MAPFVAFYSVCIVTRDCELHTRDVIPGSPSDIDGSGAARATPVDSPDSSYDKPRHFGNAPFSWRSVAFADTWAQNNTNVSS